MVCLRNPLAVTAALIAIILCTGLSQAQRFPTAPESFDLKFDGGTAVDYINAVRKAAGDVNIVIMEDVELFRMQPVELKHVTLAAALELLDGLRQDLDQRAIQLSVDAIGVDPAANEWLYTVQATVHSTSRPMQVMSHIWSLTSILQGSFTAEDVLTTIETALEMFGNSYEPATLRFHRETGLLIGRGHPEQIQAIVTVIDRLEESLHAPKEKATLEQLEDRVASAEQQLAEALRAATEWQTRAEYYLRQIDTLQGELQEARAEMRRQAARYEGIIQQLQLEEAAKKRKAPGEER